MNHAQEALRVISTLTGGDTLDQAYAYAQVHATLALVEQQRIANLIALSQASHLTESIPLEERRALSAWPLDAPHRRLKPDIAEALGLGDDND